jgi:hypothetical protein
MERDTRRCQCCGTASQEDDLSRPPRLCTPAPQLTKANLKIMHWVFSKWDVRAAASS